MIAKSSHIPPVPDLADVWTVILNWRQAEATCACVEALLASNPPINPSRVIIIDNNSQDDSITILQRRFPRIALLPQTANLGFARGMNIGIRYALEYGARAVFLLNNDAIVAPDALAQLVTTLNTQQRPGIVSAKVFCYDDPQRLWAAGAAFTGRRVLHLGAGEYDYGQYDDNSPQIVYVCAALVHGCLLRKLDGFDERFFMYYEDIDLNLRAQAAGYTVSLAPNAYVWHHDALSTRACPEQRLFYEACSRQRFFARHVHGWERARFYAEELRYLVALTLRWLREGKPRAAVAYLWGCAAAACRHPRMPGWLMRCPS